MPYVAHDANGQRVNARDLNASAWQKLRAGIASKTTYLELPGCGQRAIPTRSPSGTHFFRHPVNGDCNRDMMHPGETPAHMLAKDLLAIGAEAAGWTAELEFRRPDWDHNPPDDAATSPNWIIDVLATNAFGVQVALEFQNSEQGAFDYRRRQIRYWNAGIDAFWFAAHDERAAAGWVHNLGFPVIAVERAADRMPRWVKAGDSAFVARLVADTGDRRLEAAVTKLLTMDHSALTVRSQDCMYDALLDPEVDPRLSEAVTNPEPEWYARARARRASRDAKKQRELEGARLAAEAAAAERYRRVKAEEEERLRNAAAREQAAAVKAAAEKVQQDAAREAQEAASILAALEDERVAAEYRVRWAAEEATRAEAAREADAAARAAEERARADAVAAKQALEQATRDRAAADDLAKARNEAMAAAIAEALGVATGASVDTGPTRQGPYPTQAGIPAGQQQTDVHTTLRLNGYECSACGKAQMVAIRQTDSGIVRCPAPGCSWQAGVADLTEWSEGADRPLDRAEIRQWHWPACTGHVGPIVGHDSGDVLSFGVRVRLPIHGCG